MITIRKAVPEDLNTIVNFNISMAKETENKTLDYDTVIKGVKFLLHNDNKSATVLLYLYFIK